MINRIAICDDEYEFANALLSIIEKKYPSKYEIDIFLSSHSLLENIHKYKVLFIDYEMPKHNGLDVLDAIKGIDIIKIMVTNYDSIVFECNSYHLFWFIRKQYLNEELNKLFPFLEERLFIYEKKLTIKTANKILSIHIKDIIYIETYQNYLNIITLTQIYRIRSTFQSILVQFDGTAFSIPSYGILVNLKHVQFINFAQSTLCLNNGKIFNISRNYKENLNNEYMRYLENDNCYI